MGYCWSWDRAYAKHGREQWGRHEFYAILEEELDEVWENIKKDKPQTELVEEILQVAAVALRYLETGDRYREPNANQGTHPSTAL